MNRYTVSIVGGLLMTGTVAAADVPLFAARCTPDLNVDSSSQGEVYINGQVAKLIERPDGQISANSAGIWVDITPQGMLEPRVTYTDRDKNVGECEILSFKAPEPAYGAGDGDSAARAGRGEFDARGPVRCSERNGPWTECQAAVARDGGGSATVVVTRPDGRKRFIFFDKGEVLGADVSQADDPNQHFRASKEDDVYLIEAGQERYEIVEAMVYGG